jgi:hypothetical protein
MLYTHRALFFLAMVLCLFVVSGCGSSTKGKGATLKGTVVLPSNVKLQQNDMAAISFVPEADGGQAFTSQINTTDLSFVVQAVPGKNLTAGKYKISFRFQAYKPGESKEKKIFEGMNAKYDSTKSKLSYDVTEEPQQSITVDLNKGTVTKQ